MESIKEYEPSKEVVEFIYMDDLDEKINDTFKSWYINLNVIFLFLPLMLSILPLKLSFRM